MRAYSLLLFYICLNLSAFILNVSGVLVSSQPAYSSYSDISQQFNISAFTVAAIAIGGGITGVIALLTRQYVFASLALVIWILGLMFNIGQWLLLGVPKILSVMLPTELQYMTYVVVAICTFIFFMFMVEIATQRQIT